jgi:fibronectin type 3 domain-containing protein
MKKLHGTTRRGTRAIHSRRSALPLVIGVIAGVLSISGCSGAQNQSGVNVQVTPHVAILSWSPSTSAVVGYRVYRSRQSGMAYTLITPTLVSGTSFTDSTVVKGQTYFWVVTSVDAQFVESGFSNEVFATIPSS